MSRYIKPQAIQADSLTNEMLSTANKVGDTSTLLTTDKSSVVAAVNEVISEKIIDCSTVVAPSSTAAFPYVEYVSQSLTDAQKSQARTNIGVNIIDALTSTSSTDALSANQGYILSTNKAENVFKIDVAASVTSQAMLPNTLYCFASRSSNLTLSPASAISNIDNEYNCVLVADSSTAPTVTWQFTGLTWKGGSAPTISAGKIYEIAIMLLNDSTYLGVSVEY